MTAEARLLAIHDLASCRLAEKDPLPPNVEHDLREIERLSRDTDASELAPESARESSR